MVNAFTVYDIAFLVAFTLAVVLFLYTHRKNLTRQGILYLYRTKIGINFIERFTKKYSKLLSSIQYLVLLSGYLLMAGIIYLLIKFSWVYLTSDVAARALRVPVLIPLVPYLPELFKIDFLPSFSFTYWIIIIAIIAIPHEFAHGIFARLHKIKVHSTGFGFLGPFLAAFVEPDEKQMFKKPKVQQLSILASGTFANVIFTILFALIFWIFFVTAFVPAGVNFNSYSTVVLDTSQITIPDDFSLDDEFVAIEYNNERFYSTPESLQQTLDNNIELILVYEDTPAFKSKLKGAITHINSVPVTSFESLSNEIRSHSPGDTVQITTAYQESVRVNNIEIQEYTLDLDEKDGQTFLGIGVSPIQTSGLLGSIYSVITKIKDPLVYYESSLGQFGWFIYYFLWWTVLVSISVALVNMLPVGIFDGGRFFYLTVWGITGSEKIGRYAFSLSTWLVLALLAALMIKWVLVFT